jgi:hypothetical protein
MIEASQPPARGRTLQAMRTSGPGLVTPRRLRADRALRPVAFVVSLLLGLALAGCSGGPAPRAWAAAVCTALSPWRAEIGTLTSRTQLQMKAATSPGQAKENLVRLFGGAEAASEKARAGVEDAGVPEVEHGDEVASSFTASLSAVRDAYGRARSGIDALPTAPSDTFYTQVASVVDTLNTEYTKSELDTTKLNSTELQKAFAEVPECR